MEGGWVERVGRVGVWYGPRCLARASPGAALLPRPVNGGRRRRLPRRRRRPATAAAVALQQSHAAILASQCRVCSASAIISESMAVALAWAAAAAAGVAWRRRHRRRNRSVHCSTIMRCVCMNHVQLSSLIGINRSSASSNNGNFKANVLSGVER